MSLHFDLLPERSTRCECQKSLRKPFTGETIEVADCEAPLVSHRSNATRSIVRGIVEVDPAARIAEIGITCVLKNPALWLLQIMRKTAHFSGECRTRPLDLAQTSRTHQNPLRRILPVDAKYFDLGIIIKAGRQVRFSQAIRRKRPHDIQVVDTQANLFLDFARGESRRRLEYRAVERNILVMVGKTLRDPIPARTRRKMCRKRSRKLFHMRISTMGMFGMAPCSKPDRLTSSRSVSKRTGTSNSNPAVTASPAAGIWPATNVTRPVV